MAAERRTSALIELPRCVSVARTPCRGFEHRGTLRDIRGKKLAIDGLWALEFGSSGSNGSPDQLFFTAGPDDESRGLFGTITTG